MRYRIKVIDIISFLLFFSIVKIYAVPQAVRQAMKIIFIGITLLFLISRIKKKTVNGGFGISLLFVVSSLLGYISGELEIKQFLDGILHALCIYCIYSLMAYGSEKNCYKRILDDLYYYNLFACIISLLSILRLGRPTDYSGTDLYYFFGSKFSTSYLFVMLVGLAYVRHYSERKKDVDRKAVLWIYIILELFVSYWVGCTTTLIAGAFLSLSIIFSGKYIKRIQSFFSMPAVGVLSFVLPGFLAMNMTLIMNIPQVREFVMNVLHKSVGLTGRTYIYNNLLDIFKEKPIIGYGYNSEIVQRITRVGNAQNGLFQILIDFGICGVVAVSILVFKAFKASKGNLQFWGMKVVFFVLCICSIVEISINYYFYLSLFALLFCESYNLPRKKTTGLTILGK